MTRHHQSGRIHLPHGILLSAIAVGPFRVFVPRRPERNSTPRTRRQALWPPVENHPTRRRLGSVLDFSFGKRLLACVPIQVASAVEAVVVRVHPTNDHALLVSTSARLRQTLDLRETPGPAAWLVSLTFASWNQIALLAAPNRWVRHAA
jgi:hypothetical protein